MNQIIAVGLGGCAGSILRYCVIQFVGRHWPATNFPFGTLAVNVVGCFLIGFLGEFATARSWFTAEVRLLIFVGVLGGFTTFSAFGYETFYFLKTSQWGLAAVNVSAHIFSGLAAVMLGYWMGRMLI